MVVRVGKMGVGGVGTVTVMAVVRRGERKRRGRERRVGGRISEIRYIDGSSGFDALYKLLLCTLLNFLESRPLV